MSLANAVSPALTESPSATSTSTSSCRGEDQLRGRAELYHAELFAPLQVIADLQRADYAPGDRPRHLPHADHFLPVPDAGRDAQRDDVRLVLLGGDVRPGIVIFSRRVIQRDDVPLVRGPIDVHVEHAEEDPHDQRRPVGRVMLLHPKHLGDHPVGGAQHGSLGKVRRHRAVRITEESRECGPENRDHADHPPPGEPDAHRRQPDRNDGDRDPFALSVPAEPHTWILLRKKHETRMRLMFGNALLSGFGRLIQSPCR